MRILGCEILSYKPIIFGELIAKQFVLFEHKKLFGILFFYFRGGEQDRFHTHAFNALSFKLFGSYTEGIFDPETKEVRYEERRKVFKYFPRDSYHSINNSSGCLTVLFQGPWRKTWKEYKDGVESVLTWHRVTLKEKAE
jgi:hypothetical protein